MSRTFVLVGVLAMTIGGCDLLTGGGGADPVDVVVDVKPTPAGEADPATGEGDPAANGADQTEADDSDTPSVDELPDVGTADDSAKTTTPTPTPQTVTKPMTTTSGNRSATTDGTNVVPVDSGNRTTGNRTVKPSVGATKQIGGNRTGTTTKSTTDSTKSTGGNRTK